MKTYAYMSWSPLASERTRLKSYLCRISCVLSESVTIERGDLEKDHSPSFRQHGYLELGWYLNT
jgi:hypothetical protein